MRTSTTFAPAAGALLLSFCAVAADVPATDNGPPIVAAPASAPRYTVFTPAAPLGEASGEPSVGYNPKTDRVMYISGLQTLRATFPENFTPAQPESCEALWENKSYILTSTASLDPILFTDQTTGRTFVSQLRSQVPPAAPVLIGANSYFAYTDDDGESWNPGQIDPTNGSYDHQSVGAGPYPALLPLGTPQNHNSAVYYCSQTGVAAECARSDNGGVSFNPPAVIYNAVSDGCGGIHGHIRVAPDGTVFVPNRGCGGNQAVIVSKNAGLTWTVNKIPTSTPPPAILDPSYAPTTDSKTGYFCYINEDGRPHVAVTHDQGKTFGSDTDIGEAAGINKAVFVEAIAGDPERAACGFIGSTVDGNHQALDYEGVWYMLVAHTYDGGLSWTTVNALPDDPVQHKGGIWNQGGSSLNRNLLDFNEITYDNQGRVIYAFADGCTGRCVPNGPNSYTSKANIIRQTGGKPLFAKFDANFPQPVAPKRACIAGRRDDLGAYLTWRKPDTGGAEISGYKLLRSDAEAGPYTQVGMTGGNRAFNDRGADPAVEHYFYKVVAVNDQGDSDFSNLVDLAVGPRLSTDGPCSLPGVQVVVAPAGDEKYAQPAFDVTSVSVAEPADQDGKIVFTLKVASLKSIPPGWRWAVRFKPPTVPAGQEDYYVSMISSDGAAPSFSYGNTTTMVAGQAAPGRIFMPIGALDQGSGFNADGTITMVLDKSKIGAPAPGDNIGAIFGSVRASGPSQAPGTGGTNETIADSTSGGAYQLRDANLCLPNTEPLAVITADVTSGAAPLKVTFSGAGSSDAEDAITSYSFSFADGSEEVTQSDPVVTHTFAKDGLYPVKLIVTDARGKQSVNPATVVISVGGAKAVAPLARSRFGGALGQALLLPLFGLYGLRQRRRKLTAF